MKNFSGFFLFFAALSLLSFIACSTHSTTTTGNAVSETKKTELLKFQNEAYGFSFFYPSGWRESRADLPQRWAIVDNGRGTIIFLVSKARSNDILTLGRSQAVRDIYESKTIANLTTAKLKEVVQMVRADKFNNRSWYTYGLSFPSKGLTSLVSGTLCGQNEVMVILVSDLASFEEKKNTYMNLLNSFEC